MKTVSYIQLFTPVTGENRLFLLLLNIGHVEKGIVQDYLENLSGTEDSTDMPQCSSFFKLCFRVIYRISMIFKGMTSLI